MPGPTKQQLLARKKKAEDGLAAVRRAYMTFVASWNTLKKEEQLLLLELKETKEQKQLYDILQKIDTLRP